MQDYSQIIQRNFPNDERLGFYVKPNIPSGKQGKILNDFTRLSPGDLIACHIFGGMLGGGSIAFTAKACYYEKAFFNYEDCKGANARDRFVDVDVNQSGAAVRHTLKCENDEAAKILARVIDTIAAQPKADDLVQPAPDYSKYSKESIQWLELRDEVMRTIDLLYDRFQNGKLSLLEFEEKKADLLGRL
jgi:hypothetical protein